LGKGKPLGVFIGFLIYELVLQKFWREGELLSPLTPPATCVHLYVFNETLKDDA
jgi:hypothetical protein